MQGFRVSNRAEREFGIVPRALWLMPISADAKLCAAYLCCLRDGQAVPPVAEIERSVGLGRDARRRAFAMLEQHGVIAWAIGRDRGRIVSKELVVDHSAIRAPETQAVGAEAGKQAESHHAPEKPSDGVSGGDALDFRASPTADQAILRERKEERARMARAAKRPAARPLPEGSGQRAAGGGFDLSAVTPFLASRIRAGETCMVGGVVLEAKSDAMRRAQERLASMERA